MNENLLLELLYIVYVVYCIYVSRKIQTYRSHHKSAFASYMATGFVDLSDFSRMFFGLWSRFLYQHVQTDVSCLPFSAYIIMSTSLDDISHDRQGNQAEKLLKFK